jgi:uncharacterized ferritin-like protein (DUF455 family)
MIGCCISWYVSKVFWPRVRRDIDVLVGFKQLDEANKAGRLNSLQNQKQNSQAGLTNLTNENMPLKQTDKINVK